MKGFFVREDEFDPIILIFTILIVPFLVGWLFKFAQSFGYAHYLAFIIFCGLGIYDWRTNKNG